MPASHPNGLSSILSGIQPTELRRLETTFSLGYRGCRDPDHIQYGFLSKSTDARQERLRSRRRFVPVVRNLLNNLAALGIRASQWTNYTGAAKVPGIVKCSI